MDEQPSSAVPVDMPVPVPPPSLRPRPAGRPGSVPTRPAGVDPVVDCAVYVGGKRHAPVPPHESLRVATEQGGSVWLGLFEPTEAELSSIAARYGFTRSRWRTRSTPTSGPSSSTTTTRCSWC